MSSLCELVRSHPSVEVVRSDPISAEFVQKGDYTVSPDAEINTVLLDDEIVIKIPKSRFSDDRSALAGFEAMLVATLDDTNEKPALILPDNYDSNPERGYVVFSRVPGETLSHEQIRAFSREEKEACGWELGLFVAWMAKTISFKQYGDIIGQYEPKIAERGRAIELQALFQISPPQCFSDLPEPLGKIILDIYGKYRAMQDDGSLKPKIIGHDDLRHDNLTFTHSRHLGRWALHGVFDFGLTKPSSPERELRHLATLGPDALDPAIEAYESKTGTRLSRDLIQFWAVAQTATNYSAVIRKGNRVQAERRRKDLQTLLPKVKL